MYEDTPYRYSSDTFNYVADSLLSSALL